jgi:hypothetical protein
MSDAVPSLMCRFALLIDVPTEKRAVQGQGKYHEGRIRGNYWQDMQRAWHHCLLK